MEMKTFFGILCKKWVLVFTIFLVFLVYAPIGQAIGATYYVDQNHASSSDSNPGTEAQPWKTINHAATILVAGDTALVRSGRYNVGSSSDYTIPAVNPSNSGTAGNPITFKVYSGDAVTVFVSGGQAAIGASRRDYIVWDGFTVDMSGRLKGILLWVSDGSIIQNCTVIGDYISTSDNHDGIRIDGTNNTTVRNCVISGVTGIGEDSAALKMYEVKNLLVEHCEISSCNAGICDKNGGTSGSYDNIYRYNLVHDCKWGIWMPSSTVIPGDKFYENIFYNCSMGLYVNSNASGWEIYNNIIYNCSPNGTHIKAVVGHTLYNNIFMSNANTYGPTGNALGAFAYSDYSCFYDSGNFYLFYDVVGDLAAWQTASGLDAHSIDTNPLFINPANLDFHLQSKSPCKGTGKDGLDMGAYPRNDGTIIGTISGSIPPNPPTSLRLRLVNF